MIDGTKNSSPASLESPLTRRDSVESGDGCPHPLRRDRGGMKPQGACNQKHLLQSPLASAEARVNGFQWGDWLFGIKRTGQCADQDIQTAVRRKIGWPVGEGWTTCTLAFPDMCLVVDDPLSWPTTPEDDERPRRG